jgi:hypothetical protein
MTMHTPLRSLLASALTLALFATALPAQVVPTAERTERRISFVLGPNALMARDHGLCSGPPSYSTLTPCSSWELGIGFTMAIEGRRGSTWGGVRYFGAETELLSNSQPDPQGFAIYGGMQKRTPAGTVRLGVGPEFRNTGLFGVLALDWFTTRTIGVGIEAFGFTGPDAMYGSSLRLSVGAR